MLGPREVSSAVADRLEALLGAEVARLDEELGTATAGVLPGEDVVEELDAQPRLVTATATPAQAVGFDWWPFVQVVAPRVLATRLLDRDSERGDLVRQRWSLRLGVYARGDGYELTAGVRDRLALAVMETFLRHPAWDLERGSMTVAPDRMTYETTDIEDDGEGALVSAARVAVELDVDSILTPVPANHGRVERAVTDTRGAPWVNPGLL